MYSESRLVVSIFVLLGTFTPVLVTDAPAETLVYALQRQSPIATLDYLDATSSTRLAIEAQIMEGLMGLDPNNDLKPVPRLAEWYHKLDELTYVFKLRDNIFFHPYRPPGSSELVTHPVRPVDVVFSLERALPSSHPEAGEAARNGHLLEEVAYVRAIEGNLIKIKLSKPAQLLSSLATNLGHVTCKDYYESLGNSPEERKKRFEKEPIGTGPYRLQAPLDETPEGVKLERFEGYRDTEWLASEDAIKGVEFRYFADVATIGEQLRRGEIHMTHLMLSEFGSGDGLIDLERGPMPVEVKELAVPYLSILAFNLRQPYLDDPATRQILNAAVDRNLIAAESPSNGEALGEGVPEGYRYYLDIANESLARRAGQLQGLLDQPKTRDRLKRLQKELRANERDAGLVLWTNPNVDPTRRLLLQVVAQGIETLGIGVSIEEVESWDRRDGLEYDLLYIEWTPDIPHERDLAILYPLFSSQSRQNISHYANSKVDRLFEQIDSVHDSETQKTLYEQIQAQLLEDSPHIWLPSVRSVALVHHRDVRLNSGHSLFVYFTSFLKEVRRTR